VDAGADIFVGHGPHQIRGVDSYDGSPLFYSVGNFALQHDMIDQFPASVYEEHGLGKDATLADLEDKGMFDALRDEPRYSESILPVCEFDDDGKVSITIYPLDIGVDREGPHRGYPSIATGETATRILDRLVELSKQFGTAIEIIEEQGHVSL
jgi:poly-gamma-glutamate synthesis protein (capsule biosynthesis protein)